MSDIRTKWHLRSPSQQRPRTGFRVHKEHAETFYLMDGQFEWTVGGGTHLMNAGDLVYIPLPSSSCRIRRPAPCCARTAISTHRSRGSRRQRKQGHLRIWVWGCAQSHLGRVGRGLSFDATERCACSTCLDPATTAFPRPALPERWASAVRAIRRCSGAAAVRGRFRRR